VNKYPSKLNKKLDALEGRVQKIATDIKKTKGMLDKNNPDELKQILSNIQKEINAIEQAISHVKVNNKIQLGTEDSSDSEISQTKEAISRIMQESCIRESRPRMTKVYNARHESPRKVNGEQRDIQGPSTPNYQQRKQKSLKQTRESENDPLGKKLGCRLQVRNVLL
jgi:hypothetical protein